MIARAFHHAQFPPGRLRVERLETVSVCVPARDEAATIAGVVAPLMELQRAGVVDQVVVLDDDSRDRTGAIAAELGARGGATGGAAARLRARCSERATRCGGR